MTEEYIMGLTKEYMPTFQNLLAIYRPTDEEIDWIAEQVMANVSKTTRTSSPRTPLGRVALDAVPASNLIGAR
jgi:hypothetical protein